MRTSRTVILFLIHFGSGLAIGDEPRPVSTARLVRPDRQVEAVIGLFEGSKAAHPAAAFAAWKRASPDPNRLGKPLEALIVAFNPVMAREFRTLDGAEVAIWIEPADGRVGWGASLPNDDGTFASLATTMVLSGGEAEPPLDGLAVDRLGPAGAPLMARDPAALLVSGNREGLRVARSRTGRVSKPGDFSGVEIQVDPRSLVGSKSLDVRRFAEAMRSIEGRALNLTAGLVGSTFRATGSVSTPRGRDGRPTLKAEWLDWVPSDRPAMAFALAIDPKAQDVGAALQLADQVQRVDPAAANLAPLRLRLELLSRTIGLRTEADVWPHLEGVSGWLDDRGGLFRIHLDDEASARSIFDRIKPLPDPGPIPAARPADGRWLGRVAGRPIWLIRLGPTILACAGEGAFEASQGARDHPERSAGATLRREWGDRPPTLAGGIWPGRVPGVFVEGSPVAKAMVGSAPVTWSGSWTGSTTFRADLAWPGLDARVGRFLEAIPLDPPPDH